MSGTPLRWQEIPVFPKEAQTTEPADTRLLPSSAHQARVEAFMLQAGQRVPTEPTLPNYEERKLRATLILEEALETCWALGFHVLALRVPPTAYSDETSEGLCELNLSECGSATTSVVAPDLVNIVDGCCDVRVVTTGTLSACGVPDNPFQQEVDGNNLAKFGPGSYRRESDGKHMKPPGHKLPRILELLRLFGWTGPAGEAVDGVTSSAEPGRSETLRPVT